MSIDHDRDRRYLAAKRAAEVKWNQTVESARLLPGADAEAALKAADDQLADDYRVAWAEAVGAYHDPAHGNSGPGGPL